MNGSVVVLYWLMAGAGLVVGGGLALIPVLWVYQRAGLIGAARK